MKKILFLLVLAALALSSYSQDLGDVNGDGKLNIVDALLIARHYVGLPNSRFIESVADVNLDKTITIIDALLVAQYYVAPFTTPSPEPTAYPEEEELVKQIKEARSLWYKAGMRDYQMLYHYGAFTFAYSDFNFLVNITTPPGNYTPPMVTSVVFEDSLEPLESFWYPRIKTVDELFYLLLECVEKNYTIMNMSFHPVYGYPMKINVNPSLEALDDEFGYTISELKSSNQVNIFETDPDLNSFDGATISRAELIENHLVLTVESGGGCQNHQYAIHVGPDILESYPVQMEIILEHDNQDDYCMAIISDNVAFDLLPLAEYYKQHYGKYDSIRLNIYRDSVSREPDYSLLYEPQKYLDN